MPIFKITGPKFNQGMEVECILQALPRWFGIEEAIEHYKKETNSMETFICQKQERNIGFLSLKRHSQESYEIYVMGVREEYHRCGVGTMLLKAAEDYLRTQGALFLQVKTISREKQHPHYLKTYSFYESQGFVLLEIFPELWNISNPCALLLKDIAPQVPVPQKSNLL